MKHDISVAGGKLAAGTGVSLFGVLTLNDWALIAGIACSIIIFIQTALNILWKWQDRRKRAVRTPQDE